MGNIKSEVFILYKLTTIIALSIFLININAIFKYHFYINKGEKKENIELNSDEN